MSQYSFPPQQKSEQLPLYGGPLPESASPPVTPPVLKSYRRGKGEGNCKVFYGALAVALKAAFLRHASSDECLAIAHEYNPNITEKTISDFRSRLDLGPKQSVWRYQREQGKTTPSRKHPAISQVANPVVTSLRERLKVPVAPVVDSPATIPPTTLVDVPERVVTRTPVASLRTYREIVFTEVENGVRVGSFRLDVSESVFEAYWAPLVAKTITKKKGM